MMTGSSDLMDPRLLVLCASDEGAEMTASELGQMGLKLLGADHRPDGTQMLIFALPEDEVTDAVVIALQESDRVIDFEQVRAWATPPVVRVYTWRCSAQGGD